MGLKENTQQIRGGRGYEDKIRPKWDWKPSNIIVLKVYEIEIKSDQNGIESLV